MTSPRCEMNQRFTIAVPSGSAAVPAPMPTITPQVIISCQGSVISRLAPVAVASSAIAPSSVRLIPRFWVTAAAKGPVKP